MICRGQEISRYLLMVNSNVTDNLIRGDITMLVTAYWIFDKLGLLFRCNEVMSIICLPVRCFFVANSRDANLVLPGALAHQL